MTVTVSLKDIVEVLEMQFDEHPSFVNLDTGKVETVSSELLQMAEEFEDDEVPDLPQWQYPEWELAKRIISGRFERLPSKFDVHEWSIMEEFSNSLESERVREDFLDAIHGAGAFRNFKSALRRHRLESAWDEFREEALTEIARGWCEENKIPWK